MLAKYFLQFVLAAVFGIGVDDGTATRFGDPDDSLAGGNLACTHRPIPQDEAVCAHRWLPCGTKVVVVNLERTGLTSCRVGDRGPYGVDRHGRWKGVIDLTPHVAKAVHLDGRDIVRLLYLLPRAGNPVYENPAPLKVPRSSRPSM
jgi:hypothetical protein